MFPSCYSEKSRWQKAQHAGANYLSLSKHDFSVSLTAMVTWRHRMNTKKRLQCAPEAAKAVASIGRWYFSHRTSSSLTSNGGAWPSPDANTTCTRTDKDAFTYRCLKSRCISRINEWLYDCRNIQTIRCWKNAQGCMYDLSSQNGHTKDSTTRSTCNDSVISRGVSSF
jgi:hypothetical protein